MSARTIISSLASVQLMMSWISSCRKCILAQVQLFCFALESQPSEYSSLPASKNYFPVLRLRATPVGTPRKVMMTMTTSPADDDPPQLHHNFPCTATASPTTRESIAVKDDIHGSASTRYTKSKILREIPTRISPTAPTANAVDRHDDDDNIERQPHPTTPHRSPNEPTSNPFPSPPATNDYVARTLDELQEMMRRYSSHPALIRAPCNLPGLTPHQPSSFPQPEPVSADDGSFEVKSTLEQIAESADQLHCRIAAIFPAANDPAITTPHSPSPPPPEPFSANEGTVLTRSECADLAATIESKHLSWPSAIIANSPSPVTEPPPCGTVNSEEETKDPSLLAAAYSLDNFLLKFPRQIELPEGVERYQPSPDRRLSISRHALWTQQTLVLSTMNIVLSEIHQQLTRFIDALLRPTLHPRAINMQLAPPSRKLITPVPTVHRLQIKTTLPSQKPIPAKPPFPCSFTNLRLNRTKDYLRPP